MAYPPLFDSIFTKYIITFFAFSSVELYSIEYSKQSLNQSQQTINVAKKYLIFIFPNDMSRHRFLNFQTYIMIFIYQTLMYLGMV